MDLNEAKQYRGKKKYTFKCDWFYMIQLKFIDHKYLLP